MGKIGDWDNEDSMRKFVNRFPEAFEMVLGCWQTIIIWISYHAFFYNKSQLSNCLLSLAGQENTDSLVCVFLEATTLLESRPLSK